MAQGAAEPISDSSQRNRCVRLGSLRWLTESGVDVAAGKAFIADWSAQGATLVGLAVEQSLHAVFAVKDTVKPGAARGRRADCTSRA